MYYVYLLRCRGGSIYAGITTDLARRFKEHGKGSRGAKYTKSHPPIRYEAAFSASDRSTASRLEAALKKLSHDEKLLLAEGKMPLPDFAAACGRVEPEELKKCGENAE